MLDNVSLLEPRCTWSKKKVCFWAVGLWLTTDLWVRIINLECSSSNVIGCRDKNRADRRAPSRASRQVKCGIIRSQFDVNSPCFGYWEVGREVTFLLQTLSSAPLPSSLFKWVPPPFVAPFFGRGRRSVFQTTMRCFWTIWLLVSLTGNCHMIPMVSRWAYKSSKSGPPPMARQFGTPFNGDFLVPNHGSSCPPGTKKRTSKSYDFEGVEKNRNRDQPTETDMRFQGSDTNDWTGLVDCTRTNHDRKHILG